MDALVATPVPKSVSANFYEAPIALLETNSGRGLDLYWLPEGREQPSLLTSGARGVSDSQATDFAKRGKGSLLLKKSYFKDRSTQVLEALESLVADERLTVAQRFVALQQAICLEVESTRKIDRSQYVSLSIRAADRIAKLLRSGSTTPQTLFDMARHDRALFVHATNVAAYAVLLAKTVGVSEEEQEEIALGAMMHDIGEQNLPKQLLTKSGQLTSKERMMLEDHPRIGYMELFDHGGLSQGQLMMVYQHHEWLDGSGYPVGILEAEIHPWAKLLAVVDVFDGLTAHRRYRPALKPGEAMVQIVSGVNQQFDKELVKCWISLFRQSSPTKSGTH